MYEVLIEKLDNQGRGIAFTDDVITFIPNTLIGERVKIKITKKNKKIREAEVVEFISKSPKRVENMCKYESCGGCDLLHMSYDDELDYKETKIKEIINRFTKLDVKINNIISSELNYRNKATFQVKENVGYYKKHTYDVINIDKCLIVNDKINEILNIVKKVNLKNIYQIVVRVGNESMVIFKVNGEYNVDLNLLENIDNIIIYNKEYKVLKGKGFITTNIGKYNYIVSPDSFFQVNNECVYKLYSKVKEYVCKSNVLLDLYCGTGSIGIFLSDICNKVIGIEINEYAVKDAFINKELNRVNNIDFICKDVSLLDDYYDADTIVVDPPRSGLDTNAIEFIKKINPEKIVYVSCDPITLARDLKILSEFYNINEITPVDMFPKTQHVECVSVLSRKDK